MTADPGLQPERTTLSWGRTMLSLLVIGSVFLRWTGDVGPFALVPALGALAVVIGIQVTQRRRYRLQQEGIVAARREADVPAVLTLGLAVAAMGLAGIGVILAA